MNSIETKNINIAYGNVNIVEDLNLEIPPGKITTIIGANGCGKSTILKTIARILKAKSGDIYINSKNINRDIIRSYLKYLDENNYKSSSINRILSSLNDYYNYLVKNKIIKYNYFNDINRPRKEKKLPNFINYAEYMNLISTIEKEDNAYLRLRNLLLLEILFDTGLRVSEAVNIKIKDIDFKNHSIKVLGKGSKERIVYFGDYASNYLEEYLNLRKGIKSSDDE